MGEAATGDKMWLTHAGLLSLLLSSACGFLSGRSPIGPDPEAEWKRLEKLVEDEPGPAVAIGRSASGGTTTVDQASYPPYIRVPTFKYPVSAFKPDKGFRPLPSFASEILIVPKTSSSTGSSGTPAATSPPRKMVDLLCHDDRIYVRIIREIFKSKYSYNDLKVGKCAVNRGTSQHFYFMYYLTTDCGYKIEGKPDYVSLSNVLSYKPGGAVLREIPFNIPLECRYPRSFLSYKIGFHPRLQGGTIFKALTPKQTVALSAQDSSGNMLTGTKTYTLGQPMFFEVKKSNNSGSTVGQRMYIHKCFMTADPHSSSSVKYTVIDNQGCMVESKVATNAKFLTGPSKMSQKFTLSAFVFNNAASTASSSQQLYMHCQASVGKTPASPTSKACHYDSVAKKWRELYDNDDMCACCEGTCPSPQPRASRRTISGPSWKVDLSSNSDDEEAEPLLEWESVDPLAKESHEDGKSDFTNYWEDYD